MYEYHGWITVQGSSGDESDSEHETAISSARTVVSDLSTMAGLADIRTVNGSTQVHIAGLFNHRSLRGEKVEAAFRQIGEVAPGSYGALYIRDDEAPGSTNEFQILAMRRGEVVRFADTYLSPCIPTIEDED